MSRGLRKATDSAVVRNITDEKEIRELLDVNKNWVIYQAWNAWAEKPFNLNEEDVTQIVKDVKKDYHVESLRPWIELLEDGSVVVQYPATCRMEVRKEIGFKGVFQNG